MNPYYKIQKPRNSSTLQTSRINGAKKKEKKSIFIGIKPYTKTELTEQFPSFDQSEELLCSKYATEGREKID